MGGGKLLLTAFAVSILVSIAIISCKKEQVVSTAGIPEVEVQERTSNPCDPFPALAGLSFQTVLYNEGAQIQQMYNNFITETDISTEAEQLVNIHITQGQQAALNYASSSPNSNAALIALLKNYLDQTGQFDFNTITVTSIEIFINGYRDYICNEYKKPYYSDLQAKELTNQGMILANLTEGGWKGLLQMKKNTISDRNDTDCVTCYIVSRYYIAYYTYTGAKIGKVIGAVVGGIGAVPGMIIGGIAGGLYGVNKTLKQPSCKSCFNGNPDPSNNTCQEPTKLVVIPISCTEVDLKLAGQANLPSNNFDWFGENTTPVSISTTVPLLRVLVPIVNATAPTKMECSYTKCGSTEKDSKSTVFNLERDFLNIVGGDNSDVSVYANAANISAGQSTEVIVTTSKVWNLALYSISYTLLQGAGTIQPLNGELSRKFVTFSGAPAGIAKIRVTITSNCPNISPVSRDIQIVIN